MINVMYEPLPESVLIGGLNYPIVTDFRDWIKFVDIANNTEINDLHKIEIYKNFFLEKVPEDFSSGIMALVKFYNCDDLPKAGKSVKGSKKAIFSYLYDAGYVLAAFRQTYNIDLRAIDYMHWYEFKWLFDALPDTTAVKERINYRAVEISSIKDNKERSRIRRIQKSIELPNNIDDEDIGNIFGGMMQ